MFLAFVFEQDSFGQRGYEASGSGRTEVLRSEVEELSAKCKDAQEQLANAEGAHSDTRESHSRAMADLDAAMRQTEQRAAEAHIVLLRHDLRGKRTSSNVSHTSHTQAVSGPSGVMDGRAMSCRDMCVDLGMCA